MAGRFFCKEDYKLSASFVHVYLASEIFTNTAKLFSVSGSEIPKHTEETFHNS